MNDLDLIHAKIHEIRSLKVILDFDLAKMYGVETKVLKQAVKRNKIRFPDDFMFELTPEEYAGLRSQIVTSNKRGGTRYMPYAFTEQGVAMLSSVLNSETAIQINIGIIRAFVSLREMIYSNPLTLRLSNLENDFKELKMDLEEIFRDYNDINEDTRTQLDAINTSLSELAVQNKNNNRKRIGFNTERTDGQ